MKKKLKNILFFIIFSILFFSASAQKDNYYTLLFKKFDINRFYNDSSTFDRFVFKFKQKPICSKFYILSVIALDKNGTPLELPLDIKPDVPHYFHPWDNKFQGVFLTLTKDRMQKIGLDGSFDCILKPMEDDLPGSGDKDYVKYHLFKDDNSVEVAIKKLREHGHVKKELLTDLNFDLDPSPPAQ